MAVSLDPLARRLRTADSFTAIAAAVIETLQPLVVGVSVEAHDATGPCVWLGSAFDADAARRYVDGGHRTDELLQRLRVEHLPFADDTGTAWLCPILGCGELVGVIRVRVSGGDWGQLLHQLCTLVSVRLAQLGGIACEALGAVALTVRQYEVVTLVARGATNAEIAELLSISANAVKKHVSRALDALEVSNRTELAAVASQWTAGPRTQLSESLRIVHRPCVSKHFPSRHRAA